jgi:hypothetical protein
MPGHDHGREAPLHEGPSDEEIATTRRVLET